MSFFVFTRRTLFFKQEKLFSCCNRNFSVPSIQYWAFKFAFHLDNTINAQSESNGEKFKWEKPKPGIYYPPVNTLGFSSGSEGKELACNAGDRVWSLDLEDPMKKEMATHSSILAWRIPWAEGLGGLQSMGSQRVGHEWPTNTHSVYSACLSQ